MSIRRPHVLLSAPAAASTGAWYALDYFCDDEGSNPRPITVTMAASGDSVFIEASPDPYYSNEGTPASVSTIVTVSTFTSSGFMLLTGQWTQIRARKTGTAGVALVKGVV